MAQADNKSQFSGDLADIAVLCGEDVAVECQQKLGGADFVVPKIVREDHILNRLEPEMLDRFLKHFRYGEHVYIQNRQHRNLKKQARKLASEGLASDHIALELGVTKRYVQKLLHGAPKAIDKRQGDLFLDREER